MKNFLVVYGADMQAIQSFQDISQEDQQKEMEAWETWMNDNEKSFADMGNPVGKNTRINDKKEAKELGNEICGYSILTAQDKESALKILSESPHFSAPGSYIELMEIVDMGM